MTTIRHHPDGTCARLTCMCGALYGVDRAKCPHFTPTPEGAVQLQFVEVRFHSRDRKTYVYHNTEPRVAVGNQVRVPGRNGGEADVEVISVSYEPPPFKTKPILLELPQPEEKPDDAH